jgi:hypothetical protein
MGDILGDGGRFVSREGKGQGLVFVGEGTNPLPWKLFLHKVEVVLCLESTKTTSRQIFVWGYPLFPKRIEYLGTGQAWIRFIRFSF